MWIVWLIVCFISLIVEVSISGLVSIWISISALVCLGLSFIGGLPWWGEVIIFVGVSFILLLLTRPLVKKMMKNKKELNTNVSSLIGQHFKLIKKISSDDCGEIKINDVIWNVESIDKKEIELGKYVEVVSIIGNKLIVKEHNND